MKFAVAVITLPYGANLIDEQEIIFREIYILLKESAEPSDQKMVKYREMCGIYGQKNIDELVKVGALFYILGDYTSQDRTTEEKTPVLMAKCPIHQMAIDEFVEDMKKEAQKKAGPQSNKKIQKENAHHCTLFIP